MEANYDPTKKFKIFISVLICFLIVQSFINGLLINSIIVKNNQEDANIAVMRSFSRALSINNKEILAVMNAHNAEVESRFMGDKVLTNVTQSLFSRMNKEENTTLKKFDDCIKKYNDNETYMIITPHINSSYGISGIEMNLYDSMNFTYIGTMALSRESAYYYTMECGSVNYNITTDEITYNG